MKELERRMAKIIKYLFVIIILLVVCVLLFFVFFTDRMKPKCEAFNFSLLENEGGIDLYRNYYFINKKDTIILNLIDCSFTKNHEYAYLVCEPKLELHWADRKGRIDIKETFYYHYSDEQRSGLSFSISANGCWHTDDLNGKDVKVSSTNFNEIGLENDTTVRGRCVFMEVVKTFPVILKFDNGDEFKLINSISKLVISDGICDK